MSATTGPTIVEASRALLQRQTTSAAIVDAALARSTDPSGEGKRVFTLLLADEARAAATACDLAGPAAGKSPLAGLPVSVKDLFDLRGYSTTAGSRILKDAPVATEDAPVVARLRAAGAVIVGRTNMTEFAFSGVGLNPHFGTPRNAFDRKAARIPGGSSSGAAVSVTDEMSVGAVGTDTGGSVRIPAALSGLVGFKPTQNRVPRTGMIPLSTTLDTVGPIARSVTCCAILDAVLAGEPVAVPPPMNLRDRKFLIPTNIVLEDLEREVAECFHAAVRTLRDHGARIRETHVAEFDEMVSTSAQGVIASVEAFAWHRELLATRRAEYDPRVATRIARGATFSAADYAAMQRLQATLQAGLKKVMASHDALLLPTVPRIAPRIAEVDSSDAQFTQINSLVLRNPMFANFFDLPSISLPCHRVGSAPVGLMLMGHPGEDTELLSLALAIETALQTVRTR